MIKFKIALSIIIGIFLSFSTVEYVQASESLRSDMISVIQDDNGEITLLGPSCQELTEQDKAMRSWSLALGEDSGRFLIPIEVQTENQCRLNITNSIPKFIKVLNNFKPQINGPNCWNTVLRLSGLISFARFSSSDEIFFWLNSPYCHQLSENEEALPGDIIEIRAHGEEIHGMIYITNDLVFSKNTSSHMSAYSLQRSNLIFQNFRLNNEQCKKRHGEPVDCPRWANYYRCRNAQNDIADIENKDIQFFQLSSEVHFLESVISDYVMFKNGNYEETQLALRQRLNNVESKILNYQNKFGANDFFIGVLLQAVNSLKAQIVIIDKHQNEPKR